MKIFKEGKSDKKEIILRLEQSSRMISLIAVDEKGDEVTTLLMFDERGAVADQLAGNMLSDKGYDFENLAFDDEGRLVINKG